MIREYRENNECKTKQFVCDCCHNTEDYDSKTPKDWYWFMGSGSHTLRKNESLIGERIQLEQLQFCCETCLRKYFKDLFKLKEITCRSLHPAGAIMTPIPPVEVRQVRPCEDGPCIHNGSDSTWGCKFCRKDHPEICESRRNDHNSNFMFCVESYKKWYYDAAKKYPCPDHITQQEVQTLIDQHNTKEDK